MKFILLLTFIIFPAPLFSTLFESMPMILFPHIQIHKRNENIINILPKDMQIKHYKNNFSLNIPQEYLVATDKLISITKHLTTITDNIIDRLHYFMVKDFNQPTFLVTIQDGTIFLSKNNKSSFLCAGTFSLSPTDQRKIIKNQNFIQLQQNQFTIIMFGLSDSDVDQGIYMKTIEGLIGYLQSQPKQETVTQNEIQGIFNTYFRLANQHYQTIHNSEKSFSLAVLAIINNNEYIRH